MGYKYLIGILFPIHFGEIVDYVSAVPKGLPIQAFCAAALNAMQWVFIFWPICIAILDTIVARSFIHLRGCQAWLWMFFGNLLCNVPPLAFSIVGLILNSNAAKSVPVLVASIALLCGGAPVAWWIYEGACKQARWKAPSTESDKSESMIIGKVVDQVSDDTSSCGSEIEIV